MTALLPTSRQNSLGFTLVEMLMAMLIMTVGLLGLLQSVNIAYQQGLRNRVRDEAVLFAEGRMHDWRRLPFGEITAIGTSAVVKSIAGSPRTFTVTREQKEISNSSKNSKRMSLAVEWSIKDERASHEIYTLRTKRDDEH